MSESVVEIRCLSLRCEERKRILSQDGSRPRQSTLNELGWTAVENGYLCDIHSQPALPAPTESGANVRFSTAMGITPRDTHLPMDSSMRKDIPLMRGFLDYFPAAAADVARLSVEGNRKHNPGEELHHARRKSSDHADCIVRHLVERGTFDTDGIRHSTKVAWRALALLQEELEEEEGAPMARGAR